MDVIAWRLDSGPAIRWQVMRDLIDSLVDEVAADEARRALELVRANARWEYAA